MQDVIGKLWSERGRGGGRNEKLSGIYGYGAIEISWRDPNDGCDLAIEAKNLAQGIGRGVEVIAPETVCDHHNGSVARLV